MLSTQDCDVTSLDKETAKENIEHLEIQRESKFLNFITNPHIQSSF
jgi:hypothetical protein